MIGENSSNRMKLIKNINKAIKGINEYVEITLLDDKEDFSKYEISNTPGLVINDKIISQGKVLTDREIMNYMRVLS